MSNLTRTQIYLPTDVLLQAKIKAKSKGVKNLSQYIRDLLVQSLEINEKKKPKLTVTKLDSDQTVHISNNHNSIYDYNLQDK